MLNVYQFIEERGAPKSIKESETVRDALVIMLENDFSQLPIVNNEGLITGIISEQTISRTFYHLDEQVSLLDLKVTDCRDQARTMEVDREVFEALNRLQETYAVVIVDGRRPVGILTNYDATLFFRELAEGFALVRDIEETLRQYVDTAFSTVEEQDEAMLNAFRHLMEGEKNTAPEFHRLAFADYINLITNGRNWVKFERQLRPRELFRQYMDQVREIRNQLAHFHGDLTAVQYDVLRRARDWLLSRPSLQVSQTVEPRVELSPQERATSRGKYGPLQTWLEAQAQRVPAGFDVEIGFNELEELLGAEIPPSAREHRAWWANDATSSGRHSRAWMQAGWRVQDVDFSTGKVTFRRTNNVIYHLFYHDLLERLKSIRPGLTRATKTYPQHWWNFSGGRTGFDFGWAFGSSDDLRAELYIDTGDKDTNKFVFDALHDKKNIIEEEIGTELIWQRLNDARASRISISRPADITASADELENLKQWALENLLLMVDAFQPRIRQLQIPENIQGDMNE